MAESRIAVRDGTLVIDGRARLLYGGELQYFRVRDRHGDGPRTHAIWAERLDTLAEAGFDTISTYVPWDYHAPGPGRFDWRGPRDLRRFCELAHERGMALILKPGPHILAEWPYGFGSWGAIPRWWTASHPQELVRERSGRIYRWHPVHTRLGRRREQLPSYASQRFLEAVRGWFEAVLSQVGDRIGPGQPIFAIQLDNETNLFWSSAYRIDFHPAALALYRQRLRERHGHIAALRAAYRMWFRRFEDVLPPRRPDIGAAPWHRDWLEHQHALIERYLAAIRRLWEQLGVREPDVLFLTNDTPKTYEPIRTLVVPDGGKSRTGVFSLDTYPRSIPLPSRTLFDEPYEPDVFGRLYARWNAAHPLVAADPGAGPSARTLSVGVEIQGGHFGIPLRRPGGRSVLYPHRILPQATEQTVLRCLSGGMRTVILYTIAAGWNLDGSDYSFQSAIGFEGERTPRFEVLARIGAMLRAHEAQLRRSEPLSLGVALCVSGSQLRTARGKPPRGGQYIVGKLLRGLWGWLAAADLPPDVIDLGLETPERLRRYRALVWPSTGEPIPPGEEAMLREFVEDGGLLVQLMHRAPLRAWIGGSRLEPTGWVAPWRAEARCVFHAGGAVGSFPAPVRGIRRLRPPRDAEPLLRHAGERDRVLGFVRARGRGALAYLATSPAPLFAGRRLYLGPAEPLAQAASFARRLLALARLRPPTESAVRIEVQIRRDPARNALLLFCYSQRREASVAEIRLPELAALGLDPSLRYRVEDLLQHPPTIRSGVHAGSALAERGLRLRLGPYGSTVLRIQPA